MRNMGLAVRHIRTRLEHSTLGTNIRFEVPQVLLTNDDSDYRIGPDGVFWRAISFIEGARSFDTIQNADHAREVGYAMGMFHYLLDDLSPGTLADTLKGLHITPLYLRHYDHVLAKKYKAKKSPELDYCLNFVSERRAWAQVLEVARAEGKLLTRTIHGDPKVDNIMIDDSTGRAIGMVDLDTVRPGLVHYDIGDCLRSGCNPAGEGAEKTEDIYFDIDLCRAILEGYLSTAGRFLTENDFEYIYDSIRLIPFELGLRFFTDYLEGDVYFKVTRKGHNLDRALTQFKLTESIEAQEKTIRNVIDETRRACDL